MSQLDLSDFLKKHRLDSQFQQLATEFFVPLARELVNLHQNKQSPILVGINGAQGSGKSTLSDLLVEIFQKKYGLNAVSLSLDDFYYRREERKHLSQTIHPLFLTRGVPGTHDIVLANETLDALMHHNDTNPVMVPRFNKAIDDRFDEENWSKIERAPDIVIFEGWCVGTTAQSEALLQEPVNSLEANEDAEGVWRKHVNEQIKEHYEALFNRFDCTVMLKAPSFQCVYNWRLEQEEKLIASLSSAENVRTMSPAEIERFIQHYQRLTEHILQTLPNTAEYVFELNSQRLIERRQKVTSFNDLSIPALVFTDLDGSLLDHHTYSYQAAKSTLTYLEQNHIPVMPCSSKTQAEIEELRNELNNCHPFIIENGAAVYIPKDYFALQPADTKLKGEYWVKEFVKPHDYWLTILHSVSGEFSGMYQSFSEMSLQEIANSTGLTIEKAQQAAQRQYGEPVLWQGNEQDQLRFIKAIELQGANVLKGGRFLHVCGDANKGKALVWLTNTFQQFHKRDYTSIAIGDSHNDVQMLDIADYALIIRSPTHDIPSVKRVDNTFISEGFGPHGWAQGIQAILDDQMDHTTTLETGDHHG